MIWVDMRDLNSDGKWAWLLLGARQSIEDYQNVNGLHHKMISRRSVPLGSSKWRGDIVLGHLREHDIQGDWVDL